MTDYDWRADSYLSWELAIAALRAQHVAGRKLSPAEMLRMVDAEGQASESITGPR